MIFDNLTLAALALFVLISVFLIGTRNRIRCKGGKASQARAEKSTDR